MDPIQPTSEQPAQPSMDIMPDMDSSLDSALNNAFTKPESKGEEKTEKSEQYTKTVIKEEASKPSKSEVKNEKETAVNESKELPDPEAVQSNPPGKASAQSKEGWDALRNNYRKAHRIAQDKDSEIAKLKETLAQKGSTTQKEVEQLRSEISELSKYRAMVDIQADPEFVSKFDQPIEKAKKNVIDILRSEGVTEEVLKNFDYNNTSIMSEVIGILSQKDRIKAAKFERYITDLLGLSEQRNEALTNHKDSYKETLEKKKQESFAKQAEGEGRMIKRVNDLILEKDDKGSSRFPFLNPMEISDDADAGTKEVARQHNEMVKEMQNKVNSVIKMKEPEQQAEIAIAAVASHYLMKLLNGANSKIRSLEEEVKKISTINSDVPKKQNVPRGTNGRYSNGENETIDDALNTYFK